MISRRLDYLCLQPTREGQASYAHVYEIVSGLRRRGWDVRVVEVPHPRPGRFDWARRVLALASVQLRYLVGCGFRPAPFVYIRSHFASLPSAAVAKLARSIVVQELNSLPGDAYDAWPQLRRFDRILQAMIGAQLRWADALIAVTPGVRDHAIATSGRHDGYTVIGNGADTARFTPTAAEPVAGRRPYVVFVGALASWQGIDVVLGAIRSAAWPAGVDLMIAGEGRQGPAVEAAARADERIHWLGTVPYARVPALLAGSLAALVPMGDVPRSRLGLSPLKLFEAMASGVPVVASDVPGIADIVDEHGCGLTFPAGDELGLARAVAELASDRERARAMGERGRAAAVEHYSWDIRAGETEKLLLRVAAARPTRRRSAGQPSAGA